MSYPLRRPVYMFTVYHRICGHVLGITNSRASALQLIDALPVRIRHGMRIRAGATDHRYRGGYDGHPMLHMRCCQGRCRGPTRGGDTAIMRLLAALLVAMIAVALGATPAQAHTATAVPIVWVEDHTGWAWPVTAAEPWVDYYTRSEMRYGACRSGYRCVRVYERTIRSYWSAVTYINSNGATIYVNPQRNWYPYSWRLNILRHELVHAMGYHYHWPYCTDLMYAKVTCPDGRLAPSYLHQAIRSVLAVN